MPGRTLPPIPDLDPAAVRDAAAELAPLGPEVAAVGDRTIRTWRQVGTWYAAPETPVLLAALDPVGPVALRTADRVGALARALSAYADEVEHKLDELHRMAAARVTPEAVSRAEQLVADIEAADQTCARTIRGLSAFDFRPAAVRVGEKTDKAGVALTIGFVTIGRNAVFKETTFSDGTVMLTAVDAGDLGVTGSLGKLADIGLKGGLENGSTWKFRNAEEAAALRQQLEAYVAQQRAILYDDTGGAAVGFAIFGGVPAPRPPDLVVTEASVNVDAKAKGDVPVAAGSLGTGATGKWTTIRDVATGGTTTVRSTEGKIDASGSVTPLGVGDRDGVGGTRTTAANVAVSRDGTGRLTRVALTSTDTAEAVVTDNLVGPRAPAPGGRHRAPSLDPTGTIIGETKGSRATVTTTALDVTDANRAAVERWVAAGSPDGAGPAGDPRLHYPDTAVPGDDFQNALHQGARVTRVEYDDATEVDGIDAKIKAGWTLGFEAKAEESTSRAGKGSYLDAPGADGVRRSVPLPAR